MLRITTSETGREVKFKLEGKLSGPWVSELQRCWQASTDIYKNKEIVVELSGVTFVDTSGKQLLNTISCQGGKLTGCGLVPKSLIEEIAEPRQNRSKEPKS